MGLAKVKITLVETPLPGNIVQIIFAESSEFGGSGFSHIFKETCVSDATSPGEFEASFTPGDTLSNFDILYAAFQRDYGTNEYITISKETTGITPYIVFTAKYEIFPYVYNASDFDVDFQLTPEYSPIPNAFSFVPTISAPSISDPNDGYVKTT
ncbi:MAG: hypothetical protein PHR19_08275, partial [Bacteroidales bacterium]|nr:hypothetical protein [Bacteroidales bacterium]